MLVTSFMGMGVVVVMRVVHISCLRCQRQTQLQLQPRPQFGGDLSSRALCIASLAWSFVKGVVNESAKKKKNTKQKNKKTKKQKTKNK